MRVSKGDTGHAPVRGSLPLARHTLAAHGRRPRADPRGGRGQQDSEPERAGASRLRRPGRGPEGSARAPLPHAGERRGRPERHSQPRSPVRCLRRPRLTPETGAGKQGERRFPSELGALRWACRPQTGVDSRPRTVEGDGPPRRWNGRQKPHGHLQDGAKASDTRRHAPPARPACRPKAVRGPSFLPSSLRRPRAAAFRPGATRGRDTNVVPSLRLPPRGEAASGTLQGFF